MLTYMGSKIFSLIMQMIFLIIYMYRNIALLVDRNELENKKIIYYLFFGIIFLSELILTGL